MFYVHATSPQQTGPRKPSYAFGQPLDWSPIEQDHDLRNVVSDCSARVRLEAYVVQSEERSAFR